jgi:hypothetical protein
MGGRSSTRVTFVGPFRIGHAALSHRSSDLEKMSTPANEIVMSTVPDLMMSSSAREFATRIHMKIYMPVDSPNCEVCDHAVIVTTSPSSYLPEFARISNCALPPMTGGSGVRLTSVGDTFLAESSQGCHVIAQ